MTTARQKVLNYLHRNRSATAKDISRSLKMSAPTVRHHLRVMIRDGRLTLESVRKNYGRGRPEKMYSLPTAVLGDNLSGLSDALLEESVSKLKVDAIAKRLAGNADLSNYPIAKRMNLLVDKLNLMNYHAKWEAGAEGPRVIFGHCPYSAIVSKHPKLCEMDIQLISQLTSRPVVRESKPETQKSGSCPFVFLVR